ncbi:hypothetical protein [Absidia glauca]|uniref:Uncharacterized protein n=1 Tax=Absidia glauca TaxID=4829 RepID=A0A163JH71_ABSGL|nr:hypothetical protein [Absidia glauca]
MYQEFESPLSQLLHIVDTKMAMLTVTDPVLMIYSIQNIKKGTYWQVLGALEMLTHCRYQNGRDNCHGPRPYDLRRSKHQEGHVLASAEGVGDGVRTSRQDDLQADIAGYVAASGPCNRGGSLYRKQDNVGGVREKENHQKEP